ncbi:MAG: DUF3467 domain-containing protein [Dehalococcoidia bacterium]
MQEFLSQDDAPDFYADSVRIGAGPYGFVLDLGIQGIADTPASEPPPVKRVVLIRMSPQHALILAKLLTKNVGIYQERVGKINLPDKMYGELGLDPE